MEKIRKQMAFDVHPDVHKKIKVLAAQRGITVNMWMGRAITDRIRIEEREYDKKNNLPIMKEQP